MGVTKAKFLTSTCAGLAVLSQSLLDDIDFGNPWELSLLIIAVVLASAVVLIAGGPPALARPESPPEVHEPSKRPGKPAWTALLIGALVYLLYQAILVLQIWSMTEVLGTLTADIRGVAGQAFLQAVFIHSPMITALFSLLIGAVTIYQAPARFRLAVLSALALLMITVLAQVVAILLGNTDHLEAFKQLGPDGLTLAVQSLLLVWVLISAGFFAGIVLRWMAESIHRVFT